MTKLLMLYFISLVGCATSANQTLVQDNVETGSVKDTTEVMKTGAENIELYLGQLKNKKVGFVVNQSSKIGNQHILDFMLSEGIKPAKIFALEHGIRGTVADGDHIKNGVDSITGSPIISLYGTNRKPTKEDMTGLDVIVFDIQDVGVRFYTYISSLQLILESGAENKVKVIVLDRPNPHANYVAGPVLEDKFKSFVGAFNIPVVYGMTIGELAGMMVGERWINEAANCNYEVIKCTNYDRNKLYPLSAWPSPNLPNMRAVLLYPSLCFFEGTDVSVGRGTSKQFQIFGHPAFKDLYNFSFKPMPNVGSSSPPQMNVTCYGRDLSDLDPDMLFQKQKIDYSYVVEAFAATKKTGVELVTRASHFDRLAGTERLKTAVTSGKTIEEIEAMFSAEIEAFKSKRQKYLLY